MFVGVVVVYKVIYFFKGVYIVNVCWGDFYFVLYGVSVFEDCLYCFK